MVIGDMETEKVLSKKHSPSGRAVRCKHPDHELRAAGGVQAGPGRLHSG